jgi:diguanylate cyclase (GGDEF)-like protein/PAS domain S-box-containing protein
MTRFRLALRIGVGLASLTLLLVSLAHWCGVLPDHHQAQHARRKAVCESLAIHCSLAAQRQDESGLAEITRVIAERHPDLAHVSVIRADGLTLHQQGDVALARETPEGMIAATVPIALGDRPWGEIRLVFDARDQLGWGALWQAPLFRLSLFFGTVGLLIYGSYAVFLTRALIPAAAALPERVRETLDTFAEGVLVVDRQERIAYANKAFCALAERSTEMLAGEPAAELPWHLRDPQVNELPWRSATAQRMQQRALMGLRGSAGEHSLAVLASPIQDDGGDIYGALATFDDLTPIEAMNERLRRLLAMLQRSRAKVHQQNLDLKRLATTDPLTGCLNRREFFHRLDAIYAAAERHRHPLSGMMVDIDHFKSVNDVHGHAMGDEVLVKVSAAIRETCRESDLVCRYGGEEFCVALPHTDLEEAQQAAERIRLAVAALEFSDLKVTGSFGVSSLSLGAANLAQLLEQADQSLYVAKRSGRNRVVAFADVVDVELST